jgi:hypothetical protein
MVGLIRLGQDKKSSGYKVFIFIPFVNGAVFSINHLTLRGKNGLCCAKKIQCGLLQ